jgi:hypothetical protein
MADTPKENSNASVVVPRQDEVKTEDVTAVQAQAEATGGHDAEIKAKVLTAEEVRQKALKDDESKGLVNGIPKEEFDKMSLGDRRRAELNNPYSDLRNRITQQDEVDYQILSNTNAYTIEAMTGVSLEKLKVRSAELGVPLKDSAAGNGQPGAIHG